MLSLGKLAAGPDAGRYYEEAVARTHAPQRRKPRRCRAFERWARRVSNLRPLACELHVRVFRTASLRSVCDGYRVFASSPAAARFHTVP
jgi:hypothetical protein